jgi:hypothetical protein
MGGKASLFLVIGFSLIFMIAGRNFNNMATSTTDNFTSYFVKSKAHYIAVSGVNLIVNRLFLDATLADQTYTFSFDDGTISATLTTLDAVKNIKQLLSTGTYFGTSNTIKIIFKPSLFSKYAYFSNSEGSNIYWTSKDTVWGPFHTNGNLLVSYNPVFYGKATIGGSLTKNPSSSTPQFLGGFQKGIQIAIPTTGVTTVQTAAATAGFQFSGKSLVYFEFRGDSVRYRYATSGTGSTWTYKLASTFTSNGTIDFGNAEVHILGKVKGRYTLVASGSSGNQGDFFLDDDVYYNTDPTVYPSSTDMLGIVAKNDVWVTDNTANNTSAGIKIQASIYCETGSFGAQNYSTRAAAGFINLTGGIIQATRGAVGSLSGSTVTNGFSKRYRYDDRLLTTYPPAFPGCGTFEIVSWFE